MAVTIVSQSPNAPVNHTDPTVPLIDMQRWPDGRLRLQPYTYKGLSGGLYPDGSNEPSGAHLTAGLAASALVETLDTDGDPDASGKIVVVGIGMSNASQAFCTGGSVPGLDPDNDCVSGAWLHRWINDAAAETTDVVCVAGARASSGVLEFWDDSGDGNWDLVVTNCLTPLSLTEAQVQVLVIKEAALGPDELIPDSASRAVAETASLKLVVAAAEARYPNLRQVFVMSRGRADTSSGTGHKSIEPWAYEGGFATKQLIADYIDGTWTPGVFVTWGPYVWCGTSTRSDGMVWDLATHVDPTDGVHLTTTGRSVEGDVIHTFFMNSALTAWYRA